MSVEAGPSISAGVATAGIGVSSPGFSGESFSSGASFSAESFSGNFSPQAFDSGGSFIGSEGNSNLFSDTTPFIASDISTPEKSLGSLGDIFSSSDWSILSKGDSLAKSTQNSLIDTDFKPFTFNENQIVNEGPVKFEDLNPVDFRNSLNLSENKHTNDKAVSLTEGDWKIFEDIFLRDEFKTANNVKEITHEIKEDEGVNDSLNLDQVNSPLDSIMEIKVPKTSEPRIVTNKHQLEIDDLVEAMPDTKAVTRVTQKTGVKIENENVSNQIEVEKLMIILEELEKHETEDLEDDQDEETKKITEENAKTLKSKLMGFVVDEKAQANRKATFRQVIGEVFRLARLKNATRVSGKEAVGKIQEKIEHKSQLLIDTGHTETPDGSFHETVGKLEYLDGTDTTFETELIMKMNAMEIVNSTPAVMQNAVEKNTVSETDVRRVTKFIRN